MILGIITSMVAQLSEVTGLGTEQVSFISCILMSFVGAFVFRLAFHPKNTSTDTRLLVSGLFGVWLLFFSWGWKVLIPLADCVVTYLLLKYLNPKIAHKVTFVLSMMFLCGCHLHHLYNFHKIGRRYSTDFTGPNMILTQRITLLAFNIHDGLHKNKEDLLEDQKKYAVKKFPSFLEYFSYLFGFASIVAGPLVFYQDYMSFIKGTNYKVDRAEASSKSEPSSQRAYLQKFVIGVLMAAIFIYGGRVFPYMQNIDEDFIANTNWIYRVLFLYASLFVCRTKYYIAWSFADAVCNAAGLGFNGYDKKGKPQWNLVSNINIFAIETSTSLKAYIDNWNVMTGWWLRRACYDRVSPRYRTLLTFGLSAVWHGFFPGYYMTFLSGHLFTVAQRRVRYNIRPKFQQSTFLKVLYEVITWLATHLTIAYIVIPFVVLEFEASLRFYKSCYFCGHIIGFTIILLLPKGRGRAEESNGHSNGISNGLATEGHFSGDKSFEKFRNSSNGLVRDDGKPPIRNGATGDMLRHR